MSKRSIFFHSGGVPSSTTATRTTTASQCRALKRMALTKRGWATATDGGVVGVFGVVAWLVISELEIDERAAFGREQAEVNDHRRRHSDADHARMENFFEPRFERELIQPDQCDQCQHERRHLRC